MYNAKRTRKGSKLNADNQKPTIDPSHYLYKAFPTESPVQPGEVVEYSDEAGHDFTGVVLPEGAYLSNDVIFVRVDFGQYIDAVAAELLSPVFDYTRLDSETRIVVQQKTSEIKMLVRRSVQDIIDIGTHLIEVKAKLGHGNFGKWLNAEFSWSESSVVKMMQVATTFKNVTVTDLKIGAKVLYLLSAPSTPEEAREEALEIARSGQPVTFGAAKAIVAQHKEPAALPAGEPPRQPAPLPPVEAYKQAERVFAPVTRPPSVSYSKVEDDYVDDVPSVEVDEENPHPNLPPQAEEGTNAEVIARVREDIKAVNDEAARQRLSAIVDKQEADQLDRAQRKANWAEHERLRTLAAQTPPPVGQYRTIVIDPPWPMKKIERGVRPNQGEYLDYPTMQLADIYNLDIDPLAAQDGCHLYLWTTHKFLPEAIRIVGKWGFRYNCLMTWVKNSGMSPFHYRFNTEHVVFATRGSMAVQRKGLPLAFEGESLGHSRKPDTFYSLIAQASPAPRIDMFARCERDGFLAWGNEVNHA